jgi:hypothetical protein
VFVPVLGILVAVGLLIYFFVASRKWTVGDPSSANLTVAPGTAKDMAVSEIFTAIAKATHLSAASVRESWNELSESDLPFDVETESKVTMEFFYFYSHMTERIAFDELGEPGRDALVDMTLEWSVVPLIRVLASTATEERQKEYVAEAIADLNRAQKDYEPLELLSVDEISSDVLEDHPKAVVSRLCVNIGRVLDLPVKAHPPVPQVVVRIAVDGLAAMDLWDKIADAGHYLPSSPLPTDPQPDLANGPAPATEWPRKRPRSRPMRDR